MAMRLLPNTCIVFALGWFAGTLFVLFWLGGDFLSPPDGVYPHNMMLHLPPHAAAPSRAVKAVRSMGRGQPA